MEPFDELVRRLLSGDASTETGDWVLGGAVAGDEVVGSGGDLPHDMVLTASGFAVPASAASPRLEHVGIYVTLPLYADEEMAARGWSVDDLVAALLEGAYGREELLLSLAILNRLTELGTELVDAFTEYFLSQLSPSLGERLRGVLASSGPPVVALLARQPLLATIRAVLVEGRAETRTPRPEKPSDAHAALLSHAVAATLGSDPEDERQIGGFPERLFMEMLRLGPLYESDDMYTAIDRHSRLWFDYGSRLQRVVLRETPDDLLREAIGVGLDDVLALGFGVVAYAMSWEPGKPPYLVPDFKNVDAETVEAFLRYISDDADGLQSRLAPLEGAFDFLPLQQTPVLNAEAGLLTLDLGYLWDRITLGLFWAVHDHEKENHGEVAREHWAQAYGEMIERMAEDAIASMSVPDLGGGKTFFTEEDFGELYGGRRADAGLDLGRTLVLFEVVSGQLHTATRIEGDPEQFHRDTNRLVIEKCGQLTALADAILADPGRLTGSAEVPRIVPVVIAGGGYPVQDLTMRYIEARLAEEDLLTDGRIAPLAILRLSDLEILEALVEEGHSAGDVILRWKQSGYGHETFRNFVIAEFGGDRSYRPRRMHERVERAFDLIVNRFGWGGLRRPQ